MTVSEQQVWAMYAAQNSSERAAIVSYLRRAAEAPHPIEVGEKAMSPAGRGLLLLMADRIERGEHHANL